MSQASHANELKELMADLELDLGCIEDHLATFEKERYEPYVSIQKRLVLAENRIKVLIERYRK